MPRRRRRLIAIGAAVLALLAALRLCAGRARDAESGPLAPLAGLVGEWREVAGEERSRTVFVWGPARAFLREVRTDGDGAFVEERLYYWHAAKSDAGGSLALLGVDAEATVREGILRADDLGSLELRVNAFPRAGGGASYRERIRFLTKDDLVRSVHQKTEVEEVLVEERTLRRAR